MCLHTATYADRAPSLSCYERASIKKETRIHTHTRHTLTHTNTHITASGQECPRVVVTNPTCICIYTYVLMYSTCMYVCLHVCIYVFLYLCTVYVFMFLSVCFRYFFLYFFILCIRLFIPFLLCYLLCLSLFL